MINKPPVKKPAPTYRYYVKLPDGDFRDLEASHCAFKDGCLLFSINRSYTEAYAKGAWVSVKRLETMERECDA